MVAKIGILSEWVVLAVQPFFADLDLTLALEADEGVAMPAGAVDEVPLRADAFSGIEEFGELDFVGQADRAEVKKAFAELQDVVPGGPRHKLGLAFSGKGSKPKPEIVVDNLTVITVPSRSLAPNRSATWAISRPSITQ